jgi:glucose/arabinose dehydrogenase
VVRFTEVNGVGQDQVTIFTSPAVGPGNHNGGNIHFGPDGKLYVSIGEDANPANSQDLSVKNGKIHRLNADGSIPADNPFYGQPRVEGSIYAYGLRNSFDFDFDPVTGVLFASENGPDCDDEVNRILPGYKYGWRPDYPCDDTDPTYNTIPALWRWTPTIAPTGITFYRGTQLPDLANHLFLCGYNDGLLRMLELNTGRTQITQEVIQSLPAGVSCNQDVETGPDGGLYFVSGGGYQVATLYRMILR